MGRPNQKFWKIYRAILFIEVLWMDWYQTFLDGHRDEHGEVANKLVFMNFQISNFSPILTRFRPFRWGD